MAPIASAAAANLDDVTLSAFGQRLAQAVASLTIDDVGLVATTQVIASAEVGIAVGDLTLVSSAMASVQASAALDVDTITLTSTLQRWALASLGGTLDNIALTAAAVAPITAGAGLPVGDITSEGWATVNWRPRSTVYARSLGKVGDLAAYTRSGEGVVITLRAKRIPGSTEATTNAAEHQVFKVRIRPHELIASTWRLRTPFAGDRITINGRTCKVLDAKPLLKGRRIEGYILMVAG